MQPEIGPAVHLRNQMGTLMRRWEVDRFMLAQDVCHLLNLLICEVPTEQQGVDRCFPKLHHRIILLGLGDSTSLHTNSSSLSGLIQMSVVYLFLGRV